VLPRSKGSNVKAGAGIESFGGASAEAISQAAGQAINIRSPPLLPRRACTVSGDLTLKIHSPVKIVVSLSDRLRLLLNVRFGEGVAVKPWLWRPLPQQDFLPCTINGSSSE